MDVQLHEVVEGGWEGMWEKNNGPVFLHTMYNI